MDVFTSREMDTIYYVLIEITAGVCVWTEMMTGMCARGEIIRCGRGWLPEGIDGAHSEQRVQSAHQIDWKGTG